MTGKIQVRSKLLLFRRPTLAFKTGGQISSRTWIKDSNVIDEPRGRFNKYLTGATGVGNLDPGARMGFLLVSPRQLPTKPFLQSIAFSSSNGGIWTPHINGYLGAFFLVQSWEAKLPTHLLFNKLCNCSKMFCTTVFFSVGLVAGRALTQNLVPVKIHR